jgi:hypothetical protein
MKRTGGALLFLHPITCFSYRKYLIAEMGIKVSITDRLLL